jgi:AcrR family transcriptional regulator
MAGVEKTKQDLRSEATRQRRHRRARPVRRVRLRQRRHRGDRPGGRVTRGALYYQYRDKAALFAAVAETVRAESAPHHHGSADRRRHGPDGRAACRVRRFLEVCADPAVERIILLDAPAVLGWKAWRDLADRHGLGLLQHGAPGGDRRRRDHAPTRSSPWSRRPGLATVARARSTRAILLSASKREQRRSSLPRLRPPDIGCPLPGVLSA